MRGRTLALVVLLAVTAVGAAAAPKKKRNKNKRPPDLERGRELYLRHCIQCHGSQLDGNGPAAQALVAPVPDLAGKVRGDGKEAMVPVVLRGRNAMPGFETSFDRYDARRVLKFIERLDRGRLPEEYALEPVEEPEEDDAEDAEDAEDEG